MKSNKKKIYMISIAFLGIAVSLIVFYIWPLLTEIKTNTKELLLGKNNLATMEAQANEIENFEKKYSLYRPNLERMEQLFIDSKDPVDFIKFLEKIASDSEITSKISLMPAPEEENQTFITFQFFSNGDFLKILEFSEKLETGPYLIEIKDLTIRNYFSKKVDAIFLIKAFIKQ